MLGLRSHSIYDTASLPFPCSPIAMRGLARPLLAIDENLVKKEAGLPRGFVSAKTVGLELSKEVVTSLVKAWGLEFIAGGINSEKAR